MRFHDILNEIEATRGQNRLRAYRGISSTSAAYNAFGTFFSDSRTVAAGYSANGNVTEVELDLSAALTWTPATSADFQDYVISWLRQERLPPNAQKALAYSNAKNDDDMTMEQAVSALLREPPNRVGHLEIDPLMGFVKAYVSEQGRDVVVRRHERSAGVYDGTMEYIVFARKRIKPVSPP